MRSMSPCSMLSTPSSGATSPTVSPSPPKTTPRRRRQPLSLPAWFWPGCFPRMPRSGMPGWAPIWRSSLERRQSEGTNSAKRWAAKTVADRAGDGADVPRCVSSENQARRVCAHAHYRLLDVAERQTVCDEQSLAIPAATAGLACKRGLGSRLQRDQGPGRQGQQKPDSASDRGCILGLMTGPVSYYPIMRQLVSSKNMDVVDSARFMALTSTAIADTYIAVFDAKYHYEFWRPITAIRNGDMDDNPATALEPTWQPIDNTPMHPEYPCAHCISSAAVATVIEGVLGSAEVPEVAMTSATAPASRIVGPTFGHMPMRYLRRASTPDSTIGSPPRRSGDGSADRQARGPSPHAKERFGEGPIIRLSQCQRQATERRHASDAPTVEMTGAL